MRGLPSILLLYRNELYRSEKFRFYFSYDPKNTLKWRFGSENPKVLPYVRDFVSLRGPTS